MSETKSYGKGLDWRMIWAHCLDLSFFCTWFLSALLKSWLCLTHKNEWVLCDWVRSVNYIMWQIFNGNLQKWSLQQQQNHRFVEPFQHLCSFKSNRYIIKWEHCLNFFFLIDLYITRIAINNIIIIWHTEVPDVCTAASCCYGYSDRLVGSFDV